MALMDLGFYLINFGYIFIRMVWAEESKDAHEMIKVAAGHFGGDASSWGSSTSST